MGFRAFCCRGRPAWALRGAGHWEPAGASSQASPEQHHAVRAEGGGKAGSWPCVARRGAGRVQAPTQRQGLRSHPHLRPTLSCPVSLSCAGVRKVGLVGPFAPLQSGGQGGGDDEAGLLLLLVRLPGPLPPSVRAEGRRSP